MIRRLYARLALHTRLFHVLVRRVVARRKPDFVVGADNPEGAYLHRWWIIPRNRVLNVYLHRFLRDDDDRALHDHPWPSLSWMLAGAYIEHTIAAGGIHHRERIEAGTLRFRSARHAHRIELEPDPEGRMRPWCWTLFITGPRIRMWGFHCPEQGWIDYRRFTRPGAHGEMGAGCDA